MRKYFIVYFLLITYSVFGQDLKKSDVLAQLNLANHYWQTNHKPQVWAFWDQAAYHSGNMEFYKEFKNKNFLKYTEDWANFNEWKGAKSTDKANWKYSYGETMCCLAIGRSVFKRILIFIISIPKLTK
jgi:unsaturated rhamnogalacturonyl hydrolase